MAPPATALAPASAPLLGPGLAPAAPGRPKRPKTARMERSIQEKFALAAGSALPPLETTHRVILGDARLMPELRQPESVHLVVTSPPYWTLKRYDGGAGDKQLGHWADYESFHDELDKVWRRCLEQLAPGGRLCVVVGDVCLSRKKHGRHQVIPLHADITVRARKLGYDALTPIFWQKISNAQTEVEGTGAPFLGKPYEPNGIIKNDVEYILLFRKPGGYRSPTPEQRQRSLIPKDEFNAAFRPVWTDIPGQSRHLGHPAPFPKALAARLVRMFSFAGDTVLDPFGGTGTTTHAAAEAERSSISYEIEPAYFATAQSRLADLPVGASIEFEGESAG